MTSSNTAVRLIVRLFLSGAVLVGLFLIGKGLSKMIYIARTHETQSTAREGKLLLFVGCMVLIGCAAVVTSIGPRWAAVLIASPAVICGGLVLADDETFYPHIAALPTFALAIAGAIGVLAKRGTG
jgi:hypothetical protein